jgi:hypothetical protein
MGALVYAVELIAPTRQRSMMKGVMITSMWVRRGVSITRSRTEFTFTIRYEARGNKPSLRPLAMHERRPQGRPLRVAPSLLGRVAGHEREDRRQQHAAAPIDISEMRMTACNP